MSDKTSDTDTPAKKPLTLKRQGTLELKQSADAGQVRQSFSHGRSRPVAVEVRRKRSAKRTAETSEKTDPKAESESAQDVTSRAAKPAAKPAAAATVAPKAAPKAATSEPAKSDSKSRFVLRTLTEDEKATRARAVGDAVKAEREARVKAEVEAEREAIEEALRAKERDEAERRAAKESKRKLAEETERKKSEHAASERLIAEQEAVAAEEAASAVAAADAGPDAERTEPRAVAPKRKQDARRTPPVRRERNEPRRRAGRLTVSEALEGGDRKERGRSLAALKRQRERDRREASSGGDAAKPMVREVVVPESITVQELANRMAVRGVEVVKTLFNMGVPVTITQTLDADTAELAVAEFGQKVKRVSAADVEIGLKGEIDSDELLLPRPPVVTVMGHVDHGKTSLLDALRATDVAAGEAGGITQHIGAYQVVLPSGARITFVDTPGHAAFTQMRARGAKVTDIVVLVVAADDGIMPQTVEAINHARAAGAPIIVAINKMDRPDANADRVRNDMLQHELVTEELGGDILAVEVSAKEKLNLDKLEEAILLQAEVLELKANPARAAEGAVLEAKVDRSRGITATLLVQRGTLNVGDLIVAGAQWGRVRAMTDDRGRTAKDVGPAMPVEVLGLAGVPEAGDEFVVVESERQAREVAEFRQAKERTERTVRGSAPVSIEQMFANAGEQVLTEMPLVIKGDVQGSTEAIVGALRKLGTDEVAVQLLHTGAGGITESDVTLAQASGATVIGFNVRANKQARDMARRDGVEIRYYAVIYDVVDDIKAALEGMLKPTLREQFLGNAQVLQVFSVGKTGKIAGCRVTDGIVKRGAKVRLLRDDVVIHDGTLKTLKRFKDDVREVKEGYECGMSFEKYDDLRENDVLEFYEIEEVARKLAD